MGKCKMAGAYLLIALSLIFHCVARQIPRTGCTLKTKIPAQYTCDQTVDVTYNPDTDHQLSLSTLDECRDFCKRIGHYASALTQCYAFWFDTDTSICTVTSDKKKSVTANRKSSVVYYDTYCFNCPAACPAKPGVPVFDNGGFQLSRNSSYPWSGPAPYPDGGYGKSSRGIRCRGKSNCVVSQDIFVCPGQIYQASVDYRFPDASSIGDGEIGLLLLGQGASASFDNDSQSRSQDWQTFNQLIAYDALYTTQESGLYTQFGYNINPGTVGEADNFKLIPTNYKFKPAPKAKNILRNGDFENGKVFPFIVDEANYTKVVSPGIKSKHGLGYTFDTTYHGSYPHETFTIANLNVGYNFTATGTRIEPGTPYLLTLDYSVSYYGSQPQYEDYDVGVAFTYSFRVKPPALPFSTGEYTMKNEGTFTSVFLGQDTDFFSLDFYFYPYQYVSYTPRSILLDNISIKKLAKP